MAIGVPNIDTQKWTEVANMRQKAGYIMPPTNGKKTSLSFFPLARLSTKPPAKIKHTQDSRSHTRGCTPMSSNFFPSIICNICGNLHTTLKHTHKHVNTHTKKNNINSFLFLFFVSAAREYFVPLENNIALKKPSFFLCRINIEQPWSECQSKTKKEIRE